MRRFALLAGASLILVGCALFRSPAVREAAAPAPAVATDERDALQPASFGPRRAGSSRTVGLVPCAKGVFPATNCWSKGDAHVLYPEAPPSGVVFSPLTPPALIQPASSKE